MPTALSLTQPIVYRTQPFGANANPLYAGDGLKGHTAEDWAFTHGADVLVPADDAYCYAVRNKDNVDPMKYRAAYFLVPGWNGYSDWSEVSLGHADKILVTPGKTYKRGAKAITAGNTGDVYAGRRYVTKAEKLKGSIAGTHLHGPQVRPVKRMKNRKSSETYLTDANGYFRKDGYYFEVVNYKNGYNGCIDPAQFYPGAKFVFNRDLTIGSTGTDVRELQKLLNRHGFIVASSGNGAPGKESDYFGALTQNALKAFQKVHSITPVAGYFGPKTRRYIASMGL